jgi:prepilin-type N-terminal cleavage/methylation domain-containing protein
MGMPGERERGFTLIELLIVVAILGVLAAIVIPNVGRFIGRGENEAADTEFSNVQTAVIAMMVDNQLSGLPNPVLEANATDNMSSFPDTSVCGTHKLYDPQGNPYIITGDKDGYILYQHDIKGNNNADETVNYIATEMTKGTYYVDTSGTVYQKTTGYE